MRLVKNTPGDPMRLSDSSRLRGGALSQPVSAAALSVAANTMAILLVNAMVESVSTLVSRRIVKRVLSQFEALLVNAVCAFAAYAAVYAICGFVPMGYVDGSTTLIDLIAGRASSS